MVASSSTSSRAFKGAVLCLWLTALVIAASQLAMQFTTVGGNARSHSLTPQTNRGAARTTNRATADAAYKSPAVTETSGESASPLIMFFGGTIVLLSVVAGPVNALIIASSMVFMGFCGVALGGILLAMAAGGTMLAGGSDVVRSRVEQMDRGRWASWYFGNGQPASSH